MLKGHSTIMNSTFALKSFKLLLSLIILCLFMGTQLTAKRIERTLSVDLIEERINGKLFSSHIEVTNGSLKESWSIDGKPVDHDDYTEARKEETLKEFDLEEHSQYKKRLEIYEFKQEQRIAATKKLIKSLIIDIEKILTQFKDYNVASYMRYSADTVPSEIEFLALSSQKLDQARHLATTENNEFSCDEGDKMIATLEDYPAKLQKLFQQTVKYAIDQCTDSRQLKKLLDIVM